MVARSVAQRRAVVCLFVFLCPYCTCVPNLSLAKVKTSSFGLQARVVKGTRWVRFFHDRIASCFSDYKDYEVKFFVQNTVGKYWKLFCIVARNRIHYPICRHYIKVRVFERTHRGDSLPLVGSVCLVLSVCWGKKKAVVAVEHSCFCGRALLGL